MTAMPSSAEFEAIRAGYHRDAARSLSLRSAAYTEPAWYEVDKRYIISRTWQWVCHVEKLREPGSFFTRTLHKSGR